jgi:hypothetical protein
MRGVWVEVENGDARSLLTKSAAGRPANASAATRDDDCLILESPHVSSHFA